MKNLTWHSALELRELIRKKAVSPVEVTEKALSQLALVEPSINAFTQIAEELAMAAARDSEAKVMAGETDGLLLGVPVTVKDLIAVKDVRLTFGSRVMAENVATVDAPSVERIRTHGGIILGKTTTPEFGAKGVGDSPLTGITRNPWDLSRTPGGSSAGAAASVAAGVTPFAVGTDAAGSIRIPSAFTGLFGIKAQFGRVPIYPVAGTPTLAHVGPLSRTVRDSALLLQVMAGYDGRDAFSIPEQPADYVAACDLGIEGLKIAWSPTLGYGRPEPEVFRLVESAVEKLESLGAEVELVEEVMKDPIELVMAEYFASANARLGGYLDSARELLDPDLVRSLEAARKLDIGDYYRRVFDRYSLRQTLYDLFQRYDLIATPTLPVTAFEAGQSTPTGREHGGNVFAWLTYTYPFNLTGHPAASVPCGFGANGMPVGLQLVARPYREVDVFRAAAGLEQAIPWVDQRPAWLSE
jgi:aspartyl-tRNA(Asn)/glutamyl-tRNA(Gln) amidotransferase subunit A